MATSLTGLTPASTYKWLLHAQADGPLHATTPRVIALGDGSATPISVTQANLFVSGKLAFHEGNLIGHYTPINWPTGSITFVPSGDEEVSDGDWIEFEAGGDVPSTERWYFRDEADPEELEIQLGWDWATVVSGFAEKLTERSAIFSGQYNDNSPSGNPEILLTPKVTASYYALTLNNYAGVLSNDDLPAEAEDNGTPPVPPLHTANGYLWVQDEFGQWKQLGFGFDLATAATANTVVLRDEDAGASFGKSDGSGGVRIRGVDGEMRLWGSDIILHLSWKPDGSPERRLFAFEGVGDFEAVIQNNITEQRVYGLPDVNGTFALNSTALMLTGNQTVGGNKTWTGVQRATGQNSTPATEEETIVWSVLKRHVPRVIYSTAIKVAHSPAVANETLASFTVPGGTLGPNGWLEMRFAFTLKNTADVGTRITRFRLGGQTFKQLGSVASQNLIVGGMVVLMNRGDEGTTKQLTNHQVTDARYYWDSTNNSDAGGDDAALTVNAAINTAIDQTFEVTHANIAAGDVGILQALTVIAHYRP